MTKNRWICVLFVAGAAVALRLPQLQMRPMHGDEAVHGYKFGRLLEQNDYRYDPQEFHGPTLNYFTLIPAWLTGKTSYATITEFTLRIVPVVFGLGLVLLPLLFRDGIGRSAAMAAAAITAVSPAFVFYSRYYIQEMLLVFFTAGVITFGYRYAKDRRIIWAVLAGLCAGLMHATKETCIIAFGCMLVSLVITLLLHRGGFTQQNGGEKVKLSHLLIAVAVALAASAIFYSSFLTNPAGVLDSFQTYTVYFNRAGHSQIHNHPWYYYLKLLLYSKVSAGSPYTEGFIVILALVCILLMLVGKMPCGDKQLLRFIALYTVCVTAAYSFIPYKTPWCVLTFLHGMIILAAVGAVAVLKLVSRPSARFVLGVFFFAVALDLTLQAFTANYILYTDHNNPYVYAHPTADVYKVANRVAEVAAVHPQRHDMPIQVVCSGSDYWPLPWYLRSFTNVGYWSRVEDTLTPAPVVLASPDVEDDLISQLYGASPPGQKNLYMPLFERTVWLRPNVELRGYVTKELLDRLQRPQADNK